VTGGCLASRLRLMSVSKLPRLVYALPRFCSCETAIVSSSVHCCVSGAYAWSRRTLDFVIKEPRGTHRGISACMGVRTPVHGTPDQWPSRGATRGTQRCRQPAQTRTRTRLYTRLSLQRRGPTVASKSILFRIWRTLSSARVSRLISPVASQPTTAPCMYRIQPEHSVSLPIHGFSPTSRLTERRDCSHQFPTTGQIHTPVRPDSLLNSHRTTATSLVKPPASEPCEPATLRR